jgi:hypothetical protein
MNNFQNLNIFQNMSIFQNLKKNLKNCECHQVNRNGKQKPRQKIEKTEWKTKKNQKKSKVNLATELGQAQVLAGAQVGWARVRSNATSGM